MVKFQSLLRIFYFVCSKINNACSKYGFACLGLIYEKGRKTAKEREKTSEGKIEKMKTGSSTDWLHSFYPHTV